MGAGGCFGGLGAEPPAAGGQWGLGAKPPTAGGWGFEGKASSRRRHALKIFLQKYLILQFFAKIP